jgi:hypothetical protein
MVKYYLSLGDEEVGDMFTPYVWKKFGLDTLMQKKLINRDYGVDLKLLLIQYFVEGKFSTYIPAHPKPGNYIKKNKDIAVAVGVTPEVFHNRNEFERREFILESTLGSIKLVKEKLAKKKLDVNFDKLLSDIHEIGKEYLKSPKPYSPI